MEQLTQALAGREWLEFPGIGANPQYDQLMEAVALVKRERIDFLLAMGGGSVVDGTKFVAAAACFEGTTLGDPAGQGLHQGALPLGCVLTLPATGSESNPAAVVSRGRPSSLLQSAGATGVCGAGSRHYLQPSAAPGGQWRGGCLRPHPRAVPSPSRWGRGAGPAGGGLLQVLVDNGPRGAGGAHQLPGARQSGCGWPAWRSTASSVAACPRTGPPTPSVTSSPPCTGWIMPRAWLWCCPPLREQSAQKQGLAQFAERCGTPAARTRRCIEEAIIRTEQFFQQMGTRLADHGLSESCIPHLLQPQAFRADRPREQRDTIPTRQPGSVPRALSHPGKP